MIRINLLPVKQARKRASGQRQGLIIFLVLLVEVVGLAGFHISKASDLEEHKRNNVEMQADIARLKKEVGDYDVVKADRDELIAQRDAIGKLQSGRTGPVYVLRELSEILTKDKGPTFSKTDYEERLKRDPNAGYNPSWDPRRLWIVSWKEKERSVAIEGAAKSNDDVAEFMKRLQLSVFFSDVTLQGTKVVQGGAEGNYYTFSINCRVNY